MARIYVYPTDNSWFERLASLSPLDEVNFWQPGGQRAFTGLDEGDLLLFRRKHPVNRIAGGGVFVRSRVLPMDMAWEAFGDGNGVRDFDTFRRLIAEYKEVAPPESLPLDAPIGCIVLANPVFLPIEASREVPADYSPSLQKGKGYALDSMTGRELFAWTNDAFRVFAPHSVLASADPAAMWSGPGLARRRLGQGTFRLLVTEMFGGRCAVTGEKTLPILEAAHIQPVTRSGQHAVENGLLLRRDVHRLFDLGYVGVTTDYQFRVSGRLERDWSNGKAYYALDRTPIRLPMDEAMRPAPRLLEWQMDTVFKG